MKIGTSISITNKSIRTGQKVSLLSTDTNVPTDARSRAFAFGKNFGVWLGMLTAFSLSYNKVTPSTWQSHFGSFPKEKKHRKNAIKDIAKERFPNTDKITLATADAILIALYAKEEKC